MAWGRSLLLGGACALALPVLDGPAAAADGPGARVPKAPRAPYYDWSGLYLGLHAGYGFGTSQTDAFFGNGTVGSPAFATSASSKLDGALGGAQAGYNLQSGVWLIGVETDLAATNQRSTKAYFCPGIVCNPTLAGFDAPVGIWHEHKLDWFSTVRGRLGMTLMPQALVYATGGLAVAGVSHVGTNIGSTNTINPAETGFESHATKTGWAAGAGLEASLTGNWRGRIEYLHLDFGRDAIDASNPLNATALAVILNSRVTDNIVRLGLNYRIDPTAPPPASRIIYRAPIEATWTWSGLYLGINAAYGFGRSRTDAAFSDAGTGTPLFATGSSSAFDGLSAGAQAGYNRQLGAALVGLEMDIAGTNQHAGPTYVCPGASCNPTIIGIDTPVTVAHDIRLSWVATLRGRLGLAVTPDALIYATGGAAVAGLWHAGTVFDSTAFVAPLLDISQRTKLGWTVGAGIETHLAGNWTGKIEYLHLDFGSASTGAADLINATPVTLGINARITDDIVRLGVNYRLDPGAPPTRSGQSAMSSMDSRMSGKMMGKMTGKAPAEAAWTWTGFYFGGHAGYARGWLRNTLADPLAMTSPVTTAPTFGSLYGGVQAGYNYLLPSRLVLGVEADVSFPNFLENGLAGGLGTPQGTAVTDQIDYVATMRGRVGYAAGHWLLYATGGFAWSQARLGETPGMLADEDFVLRTRTGWTAGLGAETAIAADWTARLEYLYYHFGNAAGAFPSGTAYQSTFDLQMLRVGLNRQLDWANAGSAGWTRDTRLLASGDWNVHGQLTYVQQAYGGFHSPYSGMNSLYGDGQSKNTTSATAFVGMRPWEGTEIYLNPELMQGSGLSDTFGIAGFPNGEAFKAGFPVPRFNMARMFVRQTFGLGGEQEMMEDGPNQLPGKEDISRITVTAGKLAVTDLFLGNAYAYDPRVSFLNWNIYGGGSYDWAMDKIGYDWGAIVELNQKWWALRTGYVLIPVQSNVNQFDTHIGDRGQYAAELELRYSLFSQPGKTRLLGWMSRGWMGKYTDAVAEDPSTPNYPDITLTRQVRDSYGFLLSLEQAITRDLGVFSRTSWSSGLTEIMSMTDCDESFSLGAVLKGTSWGRPDDRIAIAGVIEGLSPSARAYFAAGGMGILIGDGALNYRPEKVLEAYYAYSVNRWSVLTFDYQFIADPAYNADRGPVSVYSLRFHAEF